LERIPLLFLFPRSIIISGNNPGLLGKNLPLRISYNNPISEIFYKNRELSKFIQLALELQNCHNVRPKVTFKETSAA
jgi:hypothetical protein